MQRTFNKALRKPYFRNGSKGLNINTLSLWTPANISTVLWLDASDASSVIISTGVSEWRDKSGNARHLSQATGANQPSYTNNTVECNATKFLATDSVQVFAGATSGSVYLVGKQPGTSGSANGGWGKFGNANPAGGANHTGFGSFGSGTLYDDFLSTSRPNIGSGNLPAPLPLSIINYENSGTQLTGRRNGSDIATVNITFSVPTQSTTYQRVGGNSEPFDLNEVVMVNSVLSTTIREKMEGYLAWKWNLVSSLPANHPYKNAAPTA